jgi:DNA adenine methylase
MAKEKNSNKTVVAPIVKWVGGKRQLLDVILANMPKRFGVYFEPFVGGGAVLFAKQPSHAVINDLNGDLIRVYVAVKNTPAQLIEILKTFQNTRSCFDAQRRLDRDPAAFSALTDVQRAARLIFLNKTCYNGIYRVNSLGEFNAPFASYAHPNIVNEETINGVHKYLSEKDVIILNGDFDAAVATARKGDFVYFDPPYDPVSATASFTGYNSGGFDRNEQERLARLCHRLDNIGVKFMLSNSSTEFIRNLYRDFRIITVKAKRNINSDGEGRGDVDEVLVMNYGKN